jgi:hypothetical protein
LLIEVSRFRPPLFARGLVRLPNHQRLLRELRLLERHTHRSGSNLPLGYTRETYEAELARRARIYANWGKTT